MLSKKILDNVLFAKHSYNKVLGFRWDTVTVFYWCPYHQKEKAESFSSMRITQVDLQGGLYYLTNPSLLMLLDQLSETLGNDSGVIDAEQNLIG